MQGRLHSPHQEPRSARVRNSRLNFGAPPARRLLLILDLPSAPQPFELIHSPTEVLRFEDVDWTITRLRVEGVDERVFQVNHHPLPSRTSSPSFKRCQPVVPQHLNSGFQVPPSSNYVTLLPIRHRLSARHRLQLMPHSSTPHVV